MKYPASSSPIDRPAKRQRQISQETEDEHKMEIHPQQFSNATTIEPKVGHTLFGRKPKH
jgi:hypothetical protein